jgi:hypothetical protein
VHDLHNLAALWRLVRECAFLIKNTIIMKLTQNNTALKSLGIMSLFFICSLSLHAQQALDGNKDLVIYDPLMWKHQLKLKADQQEKIQQINQEFYQSLYKAAQEDTQDRAALQSKANQYIHQRSQEIWDAFNANQRKKWKRMWDHYSS